VATGSAGLRWGAGLRVSAKSGEGKGLAGVGGLEAAAGAVPGGAATGPGGGLQAGASNRPLNSSRLRRCNTLFPTLSLVYVWIELIIAYLPSAAPSPSDSVLSQLSAAAGSADLTRLTKSLLRRGWISDLARVF
jgi:hypothetical protein